MSKCIGCGVELSSTKDSIGYTTNLENKLCERCFRIRNYNEYKTVSKDNKEYYEIIDSIADSLTLLIVDLFDIPGNINSLIKHLNNNVILVLTKYDLIPSNYEEKFINYFKHNYNLKILDAIVVSAKKNYHIDELYDMINKYNALGSVYLVGPTNAGKSSIINKLIYNYSSDKTTITTSNLPSTTLNTIEIKLNDITFIDTPGIVSDESIINHIDNKLLKKVIPSIKIKPITNQIKTKQYIKVEDIFIIECINKNNIVFYISNSLNINRYYKDINIDNLVKYHIKVEENNDIVVPGLGFIHVLNSDEFNIYLLKDTGYYIRNSIV